jgi:5-methylcytosine-specific restriction endonuclease McrA
MIKKYIDFIKEEYRDVTTWKSTTGNSKHVDKVMTEPSTNKSRASSVLLGDKLARDEADSLIDYFDNKVKGRLKNFVQHHNIKNPKRIKKLMVTFNNERFLELENKKGDLRCEYCNKPVTIYNIDRGSKFNERDGATADHKVPISKGGNKYDFNNLATCCYRCNQRKGNMSWEDWLVVIPTLKKYQ